MDTYIDKNYAVIDKTILGYYGKDTVLKIPLHFAGQKPERIGDGAFSSIKELQEIILPPSIRSIGTEAFAHCNNLSRIMIPGSVENLASGFIYYTMTGNPDIVFYDYLLSEKDYHMLKDISLRTHDNIYVAREFPDIPIAKQFADAAESRFRFALTIPEDTPVLFVSKDINDGNGIKALYRKAECYHFNKASKICTEDDAFREYIKSDNSESDIAKYEEYNDSFLRLDINPHYEHEWTIVFTFDDKKTKEVNGKYYIEITFRSGYFYRQSAKKIRCIGKDYYIYRRYYLTHDKDAGLIRQDVAVYHNGKPVVNRKEAEQVYAKYKLLSIL